MGTGCGKPEATLESCFLISERRSLSNQYVEVHLHEHEKIQDKVHDRNSHWAEAPLPLLQASLLKVKRISILARTHGLSNPSTNDIGNHVVPDGSGRGLFSF